jgi:hypothetical protein
MLWLCQGVWVYGRMVKNVRITSFSKYKMNGISHINEYY